MKAPRKVKHLAARRMLRDPLYQYLREDHGLGAMEAVATVRKYDAITKSFAVDNHKACNPVMLVHPTRRD